MSSKSYVSTASKGLKLSSKLPIVIVCLTLCATIITGYSAYREAKRTLTLQTETTLTSVQRSTHDLLEYYLENIRRDLFLLSDNPFIISALKRFNTTWQMLEGDASKVLQSLYIHDNPYPTGEKEKLDRADDASAYSAAHAFYHPWIRDFLNEKGYYDIFLFNTQGDLIYSVFKELDYATNMNNGMWKTSGLADVFRRAQKDGINGGNELHFIDFAPYAPSSDAPAGFVSRAVYDEEGAFIGVLAFQMPIDAINTATAAPEALGKGGENILSGPDYLARNASRFDQDGGMGAILQRTTDKSTVDAALAGKTGMNHIVDRRIEYIESYAPLSVFGNTTYVVISRIPTSEALALIVPMRHKMLWSLAIVVSLSLVCSIFFSRRITSRITRLSERIEDIAGGKNVNLPSLKDADEIGDIARSLTRINELGRRAQRVQNALDTVSRPVVITDTSFNIIYTNHAHARWLEEYTHSRINISESIFTLSPELSVLKDVDRPSFSQEIIIGSRDIVITSTKVIDADKKHVGYVTEWNDVTDHNIRIRAEDDIKKKVTSLVQSASAGDFTGRIDNISSEGFLADIAIGINTISKSCYTGLHEILAVSKALSNGDLTRFVTGDFQGMFADIQQDINQTIKTLSDVTSEIDISATDLNRTADEMSGASADLSKRTEAQASTLEETVAAMDHITAKVKENSEHASEADSFAQKTGIVAQENGKVMQQVIHAMNEISQASDRISDIVTVIDDIAFQTNLLALNAAVEAARAGDAGKGFAVVAEEVRSLAGRSATSSNEIKKLIKDSSVKVAQGKRLVSNAGETIEEVVKAFTKVSTLVSNVRVTGEAQESSIAEINIAIAEIGSATQQNAAVAEQNTAASENMLNNSSAMSELLQFFKRA